MSSSALLCMFCCVCVSAQVVVLEPIGEPLHKPPESLDDLLQSLFDPVAGNSTGDVLDDDYLSRAQNMTGAGHSNDDYYTDGEAPAEIGDNFTKMQAEEMLDDMEMMSEMAHMEQMEEETQEAAHESHEMPVPGQESNSNSTECAAMMERCKDQCAMMGGKVHEDTCKAQQGASPFTLTMEHCVCAPPGESGVVSAQPNPMAENSPLGMPFPAEEAAPADSRFNAGQDKASAQGINKPVTSLESQWAVSNSPKGTSVLAGKSHSSAGFTVGVVVGFIALAVVLAGFVYKVRPRLWNSHQYCSLPNWNKPHDRAYEMQDSGASAWADTSFGGGSAPESNGDTTQMGLFPGAGGKGDVI